MARRVDARRALWVLSMSFLRQKHGHKRLNQRFLGFNGAEGRDFFEFARLPNLGIAGLRFAVTDLAALRDHLKKHKVTLVHDLLSIDGIKRLTVLQWHKLFCICPVLQ